MLRIILLHLFRDLFQIKHILDLTTITLQLLQELHLKFPEVGSILREALATSSLKMLFYLLMEDTTTDNLSTIEFMNSLTM